jgi:hypothetical protein
MALRRGLDGEVFEEEDSQLDHLIWSLDETRNKVLERVTGLGFCSRTVRSCSTSSMAYYEWEFLIGLGYQNISGNLTLTVTDGVTTRLEINVQERDRDLKLGRNLKLPLDDLTKINEVVFTDLSEAIDYFSKEV